MDSAASVQLRFETLGPNRVGAGHSHEYAAASGFLLRRPPPLERESEIQAIGSLAVLQSSGFPPSRE